MSASRDKELEPLQKYPLGQSVPLLSELPSAQKNPAPVSHTIPEAPPRPTCICCAVLLVLRPSRAVESGRARYPESVSGRRGRRRATFWTVRARKCLAVSSLSSLASTHVSSPSSLPTSAAPPAQYLPTGHCWVSALPSGQNSPGAASKTSVRSLSRTASQLTARCQAVRPSEAGGALMTHVSCSSWPQPPPPPPTAGQGTPLRLLEPGGHQWPGSAWHGFTFSFCVRGVSWRQRQATSLVTGNALDPFCAVASARAVSPSWRRAGFGALRASRAVEANFTLLPRKRFCSSRRIPASGAVETYQTLFSGKEEEEEDEERREACLSRPLPGDAVQGFMLESPPSQKCLHSQVKGRYSPSSLLTRQDRSLPQAASCRQDSSTLPRKRTETCRCSLPRTRSRLGTSPRWMSTSLADSRSRVLLRRPWALPTLLHSKILQARVRSCGRRAGGELPTGQRVP
eukprot:767394-Hanusia_phi.AAC.2